jgi:hypothetical protein
MRFWLALILSASFALQGWATTRAADAPCPMAAEMAAAMGLVADASEGSGAEPKASDCCNDMAAFAFTGQACKAGQGCQAPTSLTALPLLVALNPIVAAPHALPGALSPPVPLSLLSAVWRPPTFI